MRKSRPITGSSIHPSGAVVDLHSMESRRTFLKILGAVATLPASSAGAQVQKIAQPAFFVPTLPTAGEEQNYNRHPFVFWWDVNTFRWRWKFTGGSFGGTWPAVRLLVDGQPATDWLQPERNSYEFTLSVANGHHIVSAEVPEGVHVFAKGFLVNSSGAPLPVQAPWTAATRFELTNNKMRYGEVQIEYPGHTVAAVRRVLKARPANSFNGVFLPKSQRWVRRIHTNTPASQLRRFVELPTGDIDIEADQKYFYLDAITVYTTRPPKMTLRDGPIGVGTLGFVYKGIMNPSDRGMYWVDTNGRFGFLWRDGRVSTLLGWRLKEGVLKAHTGIRNVHYLYAKGTNSYRPADQDFYDSKWEYVGDWSRVPEPKRFAEPWGFAGHGGHHEFWICDTLNHRILYANHWTAHPAERYQAPDYPPRGYAAPPAPTGETEVVPFILGPNEFVNEPWDCAIHAGKLYWTNFAGNSICRANLDGSDPEWVVRSSAQPSDAELGCTSRLAGGADPVTPNRDKYLIDGPLGTASCVRPQGIAFDSQGNLVWAERYTFAIRRLDFATGIVSTVALIGGAACNGKLDITLHVDSEGSVGPVDDVFVNTWMQGDFRYSKEGVLRERWMYTSGMKMRNGPLDKVEAPGYTWGFAIGHGRIIAVGSAGGFQSIEITRRLPTDPQPDARRWERGRYAFNHGAEPPMALTHGPVGEGELGFPTIDEMGGWDDDTLRRYGLENGIPVDAIDDWMYWVRWSTIDQDYAVPPAGQ